MRAAYGVCLVGVFLTCLGCGSDTTEASCGTPAAPVTLTVVNTSPAIGASVPNQGIVHSFSIYGEVHVETLALAYLPQHTAGTPEPDFSFTWKQNSVGNTYVADPVTWAQAPAHVAIVPNGEYRTSEGCTYVLSSPLFEYDVTAPVSP